MGQGDKRRVSIGAELALASAALLFFTPTLTTAQPSNQVSDTFQSGTSSKSVRRLDLASLVIPQELGQLSEVHRPSPTTPSTKTLLLIQDAHVNYDAQQHLAQILDRLIEQHGLRLVMVEGGEGDVSLSSLRQRGPQRIRQAVAEEYLQHGILSGAEYLELVSEHPFLLWGVDDQALYDQAMAAFLDVEAVRDSLHHQLTQLRELIEACRAALPANEPLRALEAARARLNREELSFGEYLAFLWKEAARLGVSTAESTNLQRFLTVSELEAGLDPAHVEREQREAVRWIRPRLSQEAFARLLDIGRRVRAAQAPPERFYHELGSLLEQAQVDEARWPHLSRYIRYLTLKAELVSKVLWRQMRSLEAILQERLIASETEAQLVVLAEGVERVARLIDLQWSADDYQAYLAHRQEWRIAQWLPILEALAARLGVTQTWPHPAAALDAHLARAVRFYEAAAARETSIIQRVLEKMDAEEQSEAVLVVGGFHTEHLADVLVEQGVQVAVITPWVGRGDERRYPTMLKAKYQHHVR